ncbi:MAG: oxaloacetate decarboxylase [Alphaproteobacteria bacterium]
MGESHHMRGAALVARTSAARFRALLAGDVAVPAVGAYDALSARLVERAGFPVVHVGGYGLAATQLGLPDVGFLTMTEMIDSVRRICATVDVPVLADGDTCYGNHLNADRLIRELERAGAAGVHIEDQAFPKRCGHMDGKRLAPAPEMVDKIKAAVDARRDPSFVLIARTDAIAVTGFEDAIARGHAYREAGADVIFIEAPETDAQVRDIPRRMGGLTLFNASWDGKSPLPALPDLGAIGYRLVLYPDTIFAATRAVMTMLDGLKAHGRYVGGDAAFTTFREFNELIGLPRVEALDARFSGSEPSSKVTA